MLSGWKAIEEYTGFGAEKLRELAELEDFPIIYVGNKVCSSEALIDNWIALRVKSVNSRNPT